MKAPEDVIGRKQQPGFGVNLYAPCWEMNPTLAWSLELLEAISSTVDFEGAASGGWTGIAMNEGLPWSVDLLSQFEAHFFPHHQELLAHNPAVWNRAVAPFLSDSLLDRVVEAL